MQYISSRIEKASKEKATETARVSTLRAQITRGRERRPLYSVLTLILSPCDIVASSRLPESRPPPPHASSRVWLQYPQRQARGQLTSSTAVQASGDPRATVGVGYFPPSLLAVRRDMPYIT